MVMVESSCASKVTGLTKSMDEINTNLLKENGQFQCQLLDEQEAQCKTLDILRTYKLRYCHWRGNICVLDSPSLQAFVRTVP